MKVKELLALLNKCNPELDALCYSEDEAILPLNHGFRVFEINTIEQKDAEKTRDKEGIPSLKLGKTKNSSSIVLIDITSDF